MIHIGVLLFAVGVLIVLRRTDTLVADRLDMLGAALIVAGVGVWAVGMIRWVWGVLT